MNFFYAYDNRGSIISETRNSVTTTYEYDALGQLTRVNDPNDQTAEITGTTWVYAYDRGGNILHKTAYNYTTEALPETYVRRWHYTYADSNWKDKLTAFDSVQITYDAIGNPLNDGMWTYTWEKGRQLKSMHNAATGVTMEFTYNHEGIRTQKVKKVNGEIVETTDYILAGKKIIGMQKGNDRLLFHYDESGSLIMLRHNGTPYTYVKNVQGDIVGLIDNAGALVVEYKYDAWGNPLSTRTLTTSDDSLAELNPFRYRGYVWDAESKVYYLKARYYSPFINRFSNQDKLIEDSTVLKGIYTYCANNPIIHIDPNGTLFVFAELYAIALITPPNMDYDLSNTFIGEQITECMSSSLYIKDRVREYIMSIPKNCNSYTKTDTAHWSYSESLNHAYITTSDLDLALSIGTISNLTITVEKQQKNFLENIFTIGTKYKVSYSYKDIYDFDNWENTNRNEALIWINDTLGYDLQEKGILAPYNYSCSGSYTLYLYEG